MSSAVILDVQGRLTVEENLGSLAELVHGLVRVGVKNVLLNLEGVWQIDCSGIGQLVRCYREVLETGGNLKLINLKLRPRRLLEMVRLLTAIEEFDTEEEAVASFEEVERIQTLKEGLGRSLRSRAPL